MFCCQSYKEGGTLHVYWNQMFNKTKSISKGCPDFQFVRNFFILLISLSPAFLTIRFKIKVIYIFTKINCNRNLRVAFFSSLICSLWGNPDFIFITTVKLYFTKLQKWMHNSSWLRNYENYENGLYDILRKRFDLCKKRFVYLSNLRKLMHNSSYILHYLVWFKLRTRTPVPQVKIQFFGTRPPPRPPAYEILALFILHALVIITSDSRGHCVTADVHYFW